MPLASFAIIVRNPPSVSIFGGSQFTVVPEAGDTTTWDLTLNGDFVLPTFGQWVISPAANMQVLVKCWGAGGAGSWGNQLTGGGAATAIANNVVVPANSFGGAGGYGTGRIVLLAGNSYVLRVGQGGRRIVTAGTGATHLAGGVNNTNFGGTQGGGYSGIFVNSVSQANALIMGGGGGGGPSSGASSVNARGGGGTTGQAGGASGGQSGGGGTQAAGGTASPFNASTAGAALTGGIAQSTVQNNASFGGGGGGYFGGGGGNIGGGGGGSGFFSATLVTSGTLTQAAGATPGNSADADRGGAGSVVPAGQAGAGGLAQGNNGRILIRLVA